MAWTKATGTIPDKIDTLIVVDPTDSNRIKDLGISGCSEDTNLGTVTFDGSSNTFSVSGVTTDDRVYFSGGTLPTGLSQVGMSADVISNVYYVVNSNQLSTTQGGSAIDFTGNGSGTTTVYKLNGISLADNTSPVTFTKTDRTSDAWGVGVVLDEVGGSNPRRLLFTDMGAGRPPVMDTNGTTGYTEVALYNRITATPGSARKIVRASLDSIPGIGYDTTTTSAWALRSDRTSGLMLKGVSALTTNIPIFVAITGQRHASNAEHRIYYEEPTSNADGTVEGDVELDAGPTQIDGIGNPADVASIQWRSQSNLLGELFMLIECPNDILSEAELQSIMEDPVGTLIDVGSSAFNPAWARSSNVMIGGA